MSNVWAVVDDDLNIVLVVLEGEQALRSFADQLFACVVSSDVNALQGRHDPFLIPGLQDWVNKTVELLVVLPVTNTCPSSLTILASTVAPWPSSFAAIRA